MSNSISSAALPIARVALRTLVVLNWVYGLAILLVLVVSIADPEWFMTALKFSAAPESGHILIGMRAIAVLGVITAPIHYIAITRLLAIVQTVGSGDPFIAENAGRLRTIGWMLFALNILSVVIGRIAASISTPAYPIHLDAGFSINGWLAVLFTFVLARVFSVGTLMRQDLEGTV